tara:strand:- start:1439 stop:2170 length:732 start_codon:yes stop_codon:yes gene_type:complete
MKDFISVKFRIWRQTSIKSEGLYEEFVLKRVSVNISLLEALDQLNEELITKDIRPITFDHDCREGICGSCGFLINGQPHGPNKGTTTCQLYMRNFNNNALINLAPWQAKSFPLIQDLSVDRKSLDNLIISGGYLSAETGNSPDANLIPISPDKAFSSFETATCIGCGACVAGCRNASSSLFVAAKIAHLGQLPQGSSNNKNRSSKMRQQMVIEGFGQCSNNLECEAVCPKEISADWISWMNKI